MRSRAGLNPLRPRGDAFREREVVVVSRQGGFAGLLARYLTVVGHWKMSRSHSARNPSVHPSRWGRGEGGQPTGPTTPYILSIGEMPCTCYPPEGGFSHTKQGCVKALVADQTARLRPAILRLAVDAAGGQRRACVEKREEFLAPLGGDCLRREHEPTLAPRRTSRNSRSCAAERTVLRSREL